MAVQHLPALALGVVCGFVLAHVTRSHRPTACLRSDCLRAAEADALRQTRELQLRRVRRSVRVFLIRHAQSESNASKVFLFLLSSACCCLGQPTPWAWLCTLCLHIPGVSTFAATFHMMVAPFPPPSPKPFTSWLSVFSGLIVSVSLIHDWKRVTVDSDTAAAPSIDPEASCPFHASRSIRGSQIHSFSRSKLIGMPPTFQSPPFKAESGMLLLLRLLSLVLVLVLGWFRLP